MYGIVFAAAMALGMVFVSGFSQPLFVASTTDAKAVSQMGIFGHITLTATDPDGKIISYIQTDNLIVNRGENCVAETMFNVTTMGDNACIGKGVTTDRFTFIAIGNGTVSVDVNDTKLAQEVNRTQDIDPDVVSSSGTGDPGSSSALVTLTAEFTAGEAVTIEESGIFDAAGKDAGNMLARKTFNPISLAKDDKLTVEWEITIGS